MVRMEGLEPPRLAALVPKTSASTNSATSAHYMPEAAKLRGHAASNQVIKNQNLKGNSSQFPQHSTKYYKFRIWQEQECSAPWAQERDKPDRCNRTF